MGFEKFEKGRLRGAGGKEITLRQSEGIGISKVAVEEWFADHDGVVLYFDEENNRVGLKPANREENPDAYRLDKSQGSGSIAASSFLKLYDLVPERTTAYDPEWDSENGLVVIDLDQNDE